MRRMLRFALPLSLLLLPFAARADEARPLAAWVQLGPAGAMQVRAVVPGAACPLIVAFKDYGAENRVDVAMRVRAVANADFPQVCEGEVPADADTAWLALSKEEGDLYQSVVHHASRSRARANYDMSNALPLLRTDPERLIVLGDTGCRLKDALVQPCNDPAQWPFAQVARSATKLWPDLVIHVGDYLYRETPCPDGNAGCAGSPYGDNWKTWDADFFAPGAALLHAAPIVIVRGNHEDCARSGPGFLRLLGPGPYDPGAPCTDHLAPYSVPLGPVNLVVMDTANAPDTSVDPGVVPTYQKEFADLASAPGPSWLLLHRPIWAAVSGPLGVPVGGNQTLIAALAGQPMPRPVTLMIAGHIHAFELLNYKGKAPPTLLAGHGGDLLDVTPANLKGAMFQGGSGVKVKDGFSVGGFGFLFMGRSGKHWQIDLLDADGRFERKCGFEGGPVDCPAPKQDQ